MSRLESKRQDAVKHSIEQLYEVLERRMVSGPLDTCPIEMHLGFLKICHAQTCGKCSACRVGLLKLQSLLEEILNQKATLDTLSLLLKTAKDIEDSADCALGYETAATFLKSVTTCKDYYISFIQNGGKAAATTYAVPCVEECPASVDIPGYVALVRDERYDEAVALIRKDNPFPTTCAFVCEHPCEKRCRRRVMDAPVNIRGLKRTAVDNMQNPPRPKMAESTGKKVAVIGGGPSGLSAAYYLAQMGHSVTVYEAKSKLGGMLRYGIPSYRFPRERLQEDLDHILTMGIQVITGVKVGKDILFEDIQKENDAIYIAIGAHTDKKVGMEGEDAEGVLSAVDLLAKIGDDEYPDFTGKKVAVLGGGNVAMDCARSAVRLGAAKVSVVYRRRREDMPALAEEVDSAAGEGIEMMNLQVPLRIEKDKDGHVAALWVKPQIIGAYGSDGRPKPFDSSKPEERMECDIVLVAIGQGIDSKHFEEAGVEVKRGVIAALNDGSFKEKKGIFSGGDCVTGPATVIKAIEGGKIAAANIDVYLGYRHVIENRISIPEAVIENKEPCGRVNMVERPACERTCDFDGVEVSMSLEEAKQEASRCLRCDYYGYGSLKGGRLEQW